MDNPEPTEWEKQFIRIPPKVTVYLLGAGASFASSYQLPMMRGFFGIGEIEIHKDLLEFLKEFYGGVEMKYWNIEEVMTYLYFRRMNSQQLLSSPLAEPDVRFTSAYTQLLQFIRKRLELTDDQANCTLHERFVEKLEPRDTVLTLNYDLAIDRALKAEDKKEKNKKVGDAKVYHEPTGRLASLERLIGPPTLFASGNIRMSEPPDDYSGRYLKLHGSLDWIYCPREGCNNNHRFVTASLPHLAEAGRPCVICGAPLATFIVPPIAVKDFTNARKLNFIWQVALDELRKAERIICIGVSFAPSDTHLRWLIRESLLTREVEPPKLTIVNPSDSDAHTTAQIFGFASVKTGKESGRVECYESINEFLTESVK